MSEVSVEIRFNSKSSGLGVADALKIAFKHEKSFEGKTCIMGEIGLGKIGFPFKSILSWRMRENTIIHQ